MQNCTLSDFTILRQLGQGGFGSAYLAVHTRTEQTVCLKFIPLQARLDEAKILSKLEDTHIIKYYGSFVEDGHFFIIMEYAVGGSLADVIKV